MKHICGKKHFTLLAVFLGLFFPLRESAADPTKYPQFAQQDLPKAMTPEFIYLDRLVDEIVNGKTPLIIDVRSGEEYEQSHIKGSISIPLDKIPLH
ncbi:MAG: rhodanese-like domain-containing protein, partial [Candidatus Binatia bacterium]